MNTAAMNTGGCEGERDASMLEQYSEEVLFAGWNPEISLLHENAVRQAAQSINLITELANLDIHAFLNRLYDL